jgi:DNA-binding CsgD family transcriptional regulator
MPPEAVANVLGPAAPGLARLSPELAPGIAAPPGENLQKAQLLEHVLGTIDRLSAVRPVMFTVEDLHWADQSTLDLTAFLIRSLRAARALFIVTYRSDELHRRHPLRPVLTGWERDRSVHRIELRRFDRDEVSAQLTAIFGGDPEPGVAEIVFDRSGGNAYLVEELAGVVRADGDPADLPPSLKDVLLTRADALSADAQRLLRVAAVAGPSVPDRLLAKVAGVGETELFATLREAVENHLLVVDPAGRGYAFRHALTRDAVYEDMLPGERVRLHAAYGEALTRDPGLADGDTVLSTMLAYHWYAALDLPRALSAAIDAANHALASYAPAEALRHLERALEMWPRVDDARQRTGLDLAEVSRLAAEAAYRSGELDRAQSLFADALAELGDPEDPARKALLLEQYALAQRDSGTPGAAAETLRQALALLPADQTTRPRAVVLAALASALMRTNDMPGAAEMARQAIVAARAVAAKDVEADGALTLGSASSYLGSPDSGLEPLRAGLRLGLELDIPWTALRGYTNLSDVLEFLGRHTEAASTAGEGLKLAERAGFARTLGCYLVGNQAEPLLRLGRWPEVDRLTAEALGALPEGVFGATLHQIRAELAIGRGHYDQAAEELRRARHAMGDTMDVQFIQPVRYGGAFIALARGDLDGARAIVAAGLEDSGLTRVARYAWPLLWLGMRIEADEATRFRDRRSEVPARIAMRCGEISRLAARLEAPTPPSTGYRAMVRAEHARADGTDDARIWTAAVAAWRGAGEPFPLAYALLRLAEAESRASERDAAARSLQEAHALAHQIGAEPIAAEAAALARLRRISLEAASPDDGPPPESADELARFGLTEREREVLLLVAAGHSNPQIARTLFISVKTASVHVSNILAKLGVSGRIEAAALVHRLGVALESAG